MLEPLRPFCLSGPAVLGNRIAVIGSTCAGKTTLAGKLANLIGLSHVELDALHWGPNWTPAPLPEFRMRVRNAVSAEGWVSDGNYHAVRDIVWSRVNTFVWLDYQLPVIVWRLLVRSLLRSITQERLWNDNRETLRGSLFSSDSLLLWAFKRFRSRRREYKQLLTGCDYQHVMRIYLPNPRVAECFCTVVRQMTSNSHQ